MIVKAFAVYDTKAQCFGVPFFLATQGLAVRAFSSLANDVNTTVGKFPTDFVLFEVGEFDDNKGLLISRDVNVNLGLASQFVVAVKPVVREEVLS